MVRALVDVYIPFAFPHLLSHHPVAYVPREANELLRVHRPWLSNLEKTGGLQPRRGFQAWSRKRYA